MGSTIGSLFLYMVIFKSTIRYILSFLLGPKSSAGERARIHACWRRKQGSHIFGSCCRAAAGEKTFYFSFFTLETRLYIYAENLNERIGKGKGQNSSTPGPTQERAERKKKKKKKSL